MSLKKKWEVYDKRTNEVAAKFFWYNSARKDAAERSWKNFEAHHGHSDDDYFVYLVRRR